ncbi:hypothetical protein N6H13_14645 [Paenibacillus sp. CC-CFT742]|nr:hypothetical protein [Paenibacillus sp. CC-CFT742]WJH32172.1 hypothetical protein N6H13_14645 [Paenibacillus sp. CC-CFT742]
MIEVDPIQIRKAAASDYPGVSLLMDELHQMHVEARPDVYRALQPRMEKQEFVALLETDKRYLYVAESVSKGDILGYGSAQLSLIQGLNCCWIARCCILMNWSLAVMGGVREQVRN